MLAPSAFWTLSFFTLFHRITSPVTHSPSHWLRSLTLLMFFLEMDRWIDCEESWRASQHDVDSYRSLLQGQLFWSLQPKSMPTLPSRRCPSLLLFHEGSCAAKGQARWEPRTNEKIDLKSRMRHRTPEVKIRHINASKVLPRFVKTNIIQYR